jgi:hypothetical protein
VEKNKPGHGIRNSSHAPDSCGKGKRMSCYYDNGTGWCNGQKKARGGYYRICWGCYKLVTKKKEEKPVKDRAKRSLLKDRDEIVKRLKRSGYNLSTIYLTAKKEEGD